VPHSDCDVLVVGAGVSGLTTGICLAEQGLRVAIWARRPPQETTSSVAGAIWGPHMVEEGEQTARRARETLRVLRELASGSHAGVRIAHGIEAHRTPAHSPGFLSRLSELTGVRPCEAAELPAGFTSGWRYGAPLAHMPTYLGYLLARFERAGGAVKAATVRSLAGAARSAGAAAVVNCAGVGAQRLAHDPSVVPVRGQVVVVANPGMDEFFIGLGDESAELIYMFPHGDTVILGGTEKVGDWNLEPYPAVAERILRDCAEIEPRLSGTRVLAHRVGLRPVRPLVRLEASRPGGAAGDTQGREGPLVVHNYGHGGAGVTLSWGCAREAAQLITERLTSERLTSERLTSERLTSERLTSGQPATEGPATEHPG